MALSTTQSIWRSGGGDNTRTAYCGSGLMVAEFYFDPTLVNTTTAKVSSAAGAATLVLPAGAVVLQIQIAAAATGGGTVDMGFTLYGTSTNTPAGLLTAYSGAGGEQMLFTNSAGTGTLLGKVMSATSMVTITGGGTTGALPTGGTISGQVVYYVTDPLLGQQNV